MTADPTAAAGDTGFDFDNYQRTVAQLESGGNPNDQSKTSSSSGLWGMLGANQRKYGSDLNGFQAFTNDTRREMTGVLGQQPTGEQSYFGHYLGGARGARVARGDYDDLAPAHVFSPRELAANKEFRDHATVGELAAAIRQRYAKASGQGGGFPDLGSETPPSGFSPEDLGSPMSGQSFAQAAAPTATDA